MSRANLESPLYRSQITKYETVGVERRASYYESAGARTWFRTAAARRDGAADRSALSVRDQNGRSVRAAAGNSED
jgi:hypothetical protein